MFDIGWQELFVIAAVAIVVIGPKDLPRVLRAASGLVRKARMIAAEFQGAINDMAHEADIEDLKKQFTESTSVDPSKLVKNTIDPSGDLRRDLTAIKRDTWQATSEHIDPAVEEGAIDEEDFAKPVPEIADESKADGPEPDPAPDVTSERPADMSQREKGHG